MITLVKLGGSLITDKRQRRTYRPDVMQRLAQEIKQAIDSKPDSQIILGHGSGSFGHYEANEHGTMAGVHDPAGWMGFAQVASAASALSQLVIETLLDTGVPAFRLQPSASVIADEGTVIDMAITPIERSLDTGLVPVVHGDVALDTVRGGTITSTETIFKYLTTNLSVERIILLGEVDGVYDQEQIVIPEITPNNFDEVKTALRGSTGVDVTGGMVTKVQDMLNLATNPPYPVVQIANGLQPDLLYKALLDEEVLGTRITNG